MSGDLPAAGAPTPANAAAVGAAADGDAAALDAATAGVAGAELRRGRGAVVVVSTQGAADPSLDTTGPVICDWMRERGFTVDSAVIVADGGPIADILAAELAGGARIVILTGGTGVTPTDRTPEAVAPFIDLEIPGLIEELRRRGADVGPRSLLTRGVAGLAAGGTFVITLPGSRGGVRDGLDIVDGVLDHLLDQVAGEGHAPRGDRAGGAA